MKQLRYVLVYCGLLASSCVWAPRATSPKPAAKLAATMPAKNPMNAEFMKTAPINYEMTMTKAVQDNRAQDYWTVVARTYIAKLAGEAIQAIATQKNDTKVITDVTDYLQKINNILESVDTTVIATIQSEAAKCPTIKSGLFGSKLEAALTGAAADNYDKQIAYFERKNNCLKKIMPSNFSIPEPTRPASRPTSPAPTARGRSRSPERKSVDAPAKLMSLAESLQQLNAAVPAKKK